MTAFHLTVCWHCRRRGMGEESCLWCARPATPPRQVIPGICCGCGGRHKTNTRGFCASCNRPEPTPRLTEQMRLDLEGVTA